MISLWLNLQNTFFYDYSIHVQELGKIFFFYLLFMMSLFLSISPKLSIPKLTRDIQSMVFQTSC